MHPFHKEATAILDVLKAAHANIAAVENPDIFLLKGKILGDLQKHINSLSVHLGHDVTDAAFQPAKTGPLTKMFGRDLTAPAPSSAATEPLVRKTAQEIEAEELRGRVDELYGQFVVTPTDDLLDALSDLEIRGVAKRAGLPVTEDNPKTLTTAYVEQIKAAIQRKDELTRIGNPDDTSFGEHTQDEDLDETGSGDSTDEDGDLAALEATLESLKAEGAHHMKIKSVEKQIADLKSAK